MEDIMGKPTLRPGVQLAREGLQAHFPIVFVPGVVSTGLELWEVRQLLTCVDVTH